jgi:hypothetical protein
MSLRTVVFEGLRKKKWSYEHVVNRTDREGEARTMKVVGLLKTALRSLYGELLEVDLVRKRAGTRENRVKFSVLAVFSGAWWLQGVRDIAISCWLGGLLVWEDHPLPPSPELQHAPCSPHAHPSIFIL